MLINIIRHNTYANSTEDVSPVAMHVDSGGLPRAGGRRARPRGQRAPRPAAARLQAEAEQVCVGVRTLRTTLTDAGEPAVY